MFAVLVGAIVVALLGVGAGYAISTRHTSPSASERVDRTPSAPGTTTPPTPPPSQGAPASTPETASASASASAFTVGLVDVNTRLGYRRASAAGTGIIVSASGEVLTNHHVIHQATSISVTVVSTGRSYTATVVGTDRTDDVAVLQLKDASGLQPAATGDSSKVKVGDAVTAVGNAGGDGGAPSISTGAVTALDRSITATDGSGGNAERLTGLIEIDAPLQPGDSGGPLYNAAGEVIGMNTAASGNRRFRTNSTDGYAIPIQSAWSIVRQIESGQASATITIGTTGFLGIGLDTASTVNGAVISDVVAGTPAEQTGLQAGDVITTVDGQAIDSPDSLTAALHGHHPGDKIALTWSDANGHTHNATVTLAVGPA